MATILDIRGTHGSGKSYVIHQLIQQGQGPGSGYICENDATIGTYVSGFELAILGTYDRVCGGCDGIRTADEIVRRVRVFAGEYKNVALEGILVAHTYTRYANLAADLTSRGHQYYFIFMMTPYEECIRRVQARRVARGQQAEFDLFHLNTDFDRCHRRLPGKMRNAGFNVSQPDWRNPVPEVKELLK